MVVVECWPFTREISDNRRRKCLQIPDYYRKCSYDAHTRIVYIDKYTYCTVQSSIRPTICDGFSIFCETCLGLVLIPFPCLVVVTCLQLCLPVLYLFHARIPTFRPAFE